MKDLRQSPEYVSFMKKRGWVVEKIDTDIKKRCIFAYLKKIPTLPFHVMKIQRFGFLPNFSDINRFGKRYKVISVTLEPGLLLNSKLENIDKLFKNNKYRKKSIPFVPSKTIHIDLKKSEPELFSQMKWAARANIRKAKKKCINNILEWNDKKIDDFYNFWKKNGKGYIPNKTEFKMLIESFKDKCFIITCSIRNTFCSGIVVLTTPVTAYYYYAVISEMGKKSFAGELAVWEALKQAKKRGCRLFDFEGIYDERYPQLKRWKGFSQFKKKFGGKEVVYPSAYEKWLFSF